MKFLVMVIFAIALIIVVAVIISIIGTMRTNSERPRKQVRNFKVRFDAAKEKYYIVNELETYDEPVVNSFGLRVMYKDKPKADFVCNKYNS